jgi:hypothetical protein
MVSMPNPFVPPAICAGVTLAAGLGLAFLRTRIRARFLIILDVVVLACAFLPVGIAAALLRSAAHAPKDDLWLYALGLVTLPLAYLPLRFTGGRWGTTIALSAALVVTRIYAELLMAALNTDGFTGPVFVLLALALLCAWLTARLLPSR